MTRTMVCQRNDLSDLERTVLWCIRACVIGHSGHARYMKKIQTIFFRLDIDDAIPDLHGFMMTLARGARRMIDVNCVCFPQVSADERALLDAFAFQQREEYEEAFDILLALMSDAAAPDACDYLTRLALAFSTAGFVCDRPNGLLWLKSRDTARSLTVPR